MAVINGNGMNSVVQLAMFVALLLASYVQTAKAEAWINEFHYDNTGPDANEFIEIAYTTDITGYSVVLYNGLTGARYGTDQTLTTTTPSGVGLIVIDYPSNGIQNGSPDGIALVDATGSVVEFISYEGTFVAVDGPATGMTSTNIGVIENSNAATDE